MEALKKKVREIGMPRIIIVAFIIVILIAAMIQKQDMATLITDSLVLSVRICCWRWQCCPVCWLAPG